jgi:pSer/pThr/pTyr-binding forkhead associated (FHA) protein
MLVKENGDQFPLTLKQITLGRNSATKNIINDIDLSSLDLKKIISRRHAMVELQNNEFYLHDLHSHNGSFLNGERVAPHKPQKLKSGDVIEIGSGGVKLKFVR